MAKFTSTGMLVAVAASVPATQDQVGYEALTFTNIAEVTTINAFGAQADVVNSQPLATGITEKFKGFVNYGSTSIEIDYDPDDAAAVILEAAVEGATKNDRHSFRITYPNGAVRYFGSKVFSVPENPGGANSMVTRSVTLEIETPIVRVA